MSGVTTVDGTPEPQVLRFQPISTPTGMAENSAETISISPNPSQGIFTVSSTDMSAASLAIEVTDVKGKIVFNAPSFLSGTVTVDISSQPKGMYFVKISNGVKQHCEKR
ncbi:MAG: T9SS type A sorting domain-containing protein [Flammeovirgaceae bacterium]|nr:T9SS type A sorting domain-containing protein [Flammeovirgaceae bacterium]